MRPSERGALSEQTGRQAEEAAARFLIKKGYELLGRRYRCRFGEIDLIMRDRDQIVFVEVKYRRNCDWGTPAESVNAAKRRKLLLAARAYLGETGTEDLSCRFDLVEITVIEGKRMARHIENMMGGE